MNKSALEKFATEARRELLERVELQARKIGITKDLIQTANVESSDAVFIDGIHLSHVERKQRNKLIARINEIGFDRVMDETAYTWFNRFAALRFMEVNEYLPTKVRVLSSSNEESVEPDMMREALSLDLEVDKKLVYELKMNNDTDGLFKYLIKVHCNDLNRYMPFMFESIEDYKEILFPEGLLGSDALISRLINVELIPEEDWTNIEIIGWLYQYYIAEEKNRVFKAKAKYKAEEIPYATQLFTPDWIVRYMVQNSLGRYWTEAHPEHEDLIKDWKYFIHHEEEDFQEKIDPYINKELNVEDIKCFDPAMGSGHILVYMFDVLYKIYTKCGYMEREIPRLIIENNIYGLDIDDRAYQLASFSVVMKALQYNRRFLRSIEREGLVLNLASVQETNGWTEELFAYLAGDESGSTYDSVKLFVEQYKNAKTFGSLIRLSETDTSFVEQKLSELKQSPVTNLFEEHQREQVLELLPQLIHQTKMMRRQYDVVVMNPPYMGSGSMNQELSDFLKRNYPDSKTDLFAAFMDVDFYLKTNGFYAAINQHVWMFLSSFEKLRSKILDSKYVDSMLHLGPKAFDEIGGEVVQSTTFVLRNISGLNLQGVYLDLNKGSNSFEKKKIAINCLKDPAHKDRYHFNQKKFNLISGKRLGYWLTDNMISVFKKGELLSHFGVARRGLQTGNSSRFIRYWFEVDSRKTYLLNEPFSVALSEKYKWFLLNSGGSYRKWYGNIIEVVNWKNNGEDIKATGKAIIPSENKYFKSCITWNKVSSGNISIRHQSVGIIPGDASPFFYCEDNDTKKYIMALLNSSTANEFMRVLSPTLNFEVGNISKFPVFLEKDKINEISKIVDKNIDIVKEEWDSHEISFEFKTHPLIDQYNKKLKDSYENWIKSYGLRREELNRNEERINNIFLSLYGIHDEAPSIIKDNQSVFKQPNLVQEVKSFISYCIGCCLGRFSLDEKGLIYAGGKFDPSLYRIFSADEDNILSVLPNSYFEDDIVTKLIDFVRVTFSKESLEENLSFIANALGRKSNETSRETLRRYFLNDFYRDHVQTYKKRPIYWLFTSGKEKAFNCLIYMHRYDKTTLSRIRTDYLHEVQNRMDAEKRDLLAVIESDSTTKEISAAKKTLKSLDKKIDELKAYDELLHHMADQQIEIDLDDGVKVNYEKFKGLVAKIN